MPRNQFSILQLPAVIGNDGTHPIRILPEEPEAFRCLLGIAGAELLAGPVRQLSDKFRIEKTSVSERGLIRLGLKRSKRVSVAIQARTISAGSGHCRGDNDCGGGREQLAECHMS